MDSKRIAFWAVAALLLASLYLVWFCQPERQVRRHQVALIKAIEKRNWKDVDALIAETYADRWEHDKEFVISGSREVFRQFLFLTIQQEITAFTNEGSAAQVKALIRISGSGSPLAQYAMAKVNTLVEPFTFTWAKSGWQPWSWRMTRVEHPTLEVGSALEF
jgi:hypothetical protein